MKRTALDDVLRQQGAAWRSEQPPDPTFGASAGRGDSRRATWLVPLAAAAAVVTVAVGTTVAVRGNNPANRKDSATATSAIVGWVAHPAGPRQSPSFYSGP